MVTTILTPAARIKISKFLPLAGLVKILTFLLFTLSRSAKHLIGVVFHHKFSGTNGISRNFKEKIMKIKKLNIAIF